jgi:hypothetical protein
MDEFAAAAAAVVGAVVLEIADADLVDCISSRGAIEIRSVFEK